MTDRATLVSHARTSIAKGSKSFAAASGLFDRTTRERVWLLYAWCRACDDIADGQDHGHRSAPQADAAAGLETIRSLTAQALNGKETGHFAFDALGQLSREVPILPDVAQDVIGGFALDAQDWRPRSEADLLRYCYHVAGAVGVMMALVMGVPASDEDTLDRACDLGIAFQLANILRDICDDDAAGRCYLPVEWLVEADIPPGEVTKPHYRDALVTLAARLCRLFERYEASARVGAARLRFRHRWAILSAARIYGAIAKDVEDRGAHAWDHRSFTTGTQKLGHVARALIESIQRPASAPKPEVSRRDLVALSREGH